MLRKCGDTACSIGKINFVVPIESLGKFIEVKYQKVCLFCTNAIIAGAFVLGIFILGQMRIMQEIWFPEIGNFALAVRKMVLVN